MDKRNFLILLIVALLAKSTLCFAAPKQMDNRQYLPYVQVGATRFFKINSGNSATSYDLFVPIWQLPEHLAFTDLRIYDRSGHSVEWNLHMGYRHLLDDEQQVYGIYAAFDRKRTALGNYFNQLTFGGECWLDKLFLGGNFYYPIGNKNKPLSSMTTANFKNISGNLYNIWITQNTLYEKAMGGVDAEIGYELIPGLTGYAGGYYFKSNGTETICGPKAKIVYDWFLKNGKKIIGIFDKLGLETGIQNDTQRGTVWYLSANFKVGLLPNKQVSLQGAARHMADLIRRDVDIISTATPNSTNDILKEDGEEVTVGVVDDDTQDIIAHLNSNDGPDIVLVKSANAQHHELSVATKQRRKNKRLIFGNHVDITAPSGGTHKLHLPQAGSAKAVSKLHQQLRQFKHGSVIQIENMPRTKKVHTTKRNKQNIPFVQNNPAPITPVKTTKQNFANSTIFQESTPIIQSIKPTKNSHGSQTYNPHRKAQPQEVLPSEIDPNSVAIVTIPATSAHKASTQTTSNNIILALPAPQTPNVETQSTINKIEQPQEILPPEIDPNSVAIVTIPATSAHKASTQTTSDNIVLALAPQPKVTKQNLASQETLFIALEPTNSNTSGISLKKDSEQSLNNSRTTLESSPVQSSLLQNTTNTKQISSDTQGNSFMITLKDSLQNSPAPTIMPGYKDLNTFLRHDLPIFGGLGALTAITYYFAKMASTGPKVTSSPETQFV